MKMYLSSIVQELKDSIANVEKYAEQLRVETDAVNSARRRLAAAICLELDAHPQSEPRVVIDNALWMVDRSGFAHEMEAIPDLTYAKTIVDDDRFPVRAGRDEHPEPPPVAPPIDAASEAPSTLPTEESEPLEF